jgi:hypothetical protein
MNFKLHNKATLARKLILLPLLASLLPAASFAAPQGAPTQQANPTVSAPTTLVKQEPGNIYDDVGFPSLGGNYMAYYYCPQSIIAPCNIRVMDLTTKQSTTISSSPYSQNLPDTDGQTVVWMDARATKKSDVASKYDQYDVDFDIYAAKLSDKKEFLVFQGPKLQNRPKVAGDVIVWADYSDAKNKDDLEAGNVSMYRISTGKVSVVSNAHSAQHYPDTDGKTIVWVDYRNEPDPQGFNSDIYGYDVASSREFVIANAPDTEQDPHVVGNTVVYFNWGDVSGAKPGFYGYDLTTNKSYPLLVDSSFVNADFSERWAFNLDLSSNLLVWQDRRKEQSNAKFADVHGLDLATKREFVVAEGTGYQHTPSVAGDKVVYSESASGDSSNREDVTLKMVTVSGPGSGSSAGPLAPPVALPGTNSQTFPETKKTVTGLFLDYWTGNGQLAQQGYPISEVMGEKSDLNGQTYTVQYFERAVFEYHPEIADPRYKVLLSQLGTFQYKKKYPSGAPNQKPSTDNAIKFNETGKSLGGKFRTYWEKNGGLAQQGLPISDEFAEVSDLNGKTYIVQYFERAVFEMHPENAGSPYEVLLSQLGTFQHKAKYQGGSQPQPQPTAQPTVQPTAVADPCANVPAGQNATVTPTCGKVGTIFTITGTGFTPGEQVGRYYTRPNGTVVPGSSQSTADSNGTVTFRFSSEGATASEQGQWAGTFEGVTSHKKAIAYFKVIAP